MAREHLSNDSRRVLQLKQLGTQGLGEAKSKATVSELRGSFSTSACIRMRVSILS